eukprot:TRINITY_DN34714_c0_g1_i1.p1 TRINITY_DN34714_c0_g1~~TRINITY_DN34714_c0_g1_i1.p1  ORF type:complete len:551 (+),score=130.42 TRINITY_DN34714_c0_g1_i1:95-1747(+)
MAAPPAAEPSRASSFAARVRAAVKEARYQEQVAENGKRGSSDSSIRPSRSEELPASRRPEKSATPTELRCKDYFGRWHSVKQLRERRNAAVLKGMRWMQKFLTADRCAALVDIGDDAACIFFEIWYTSSSSIIRGAAKGIAQELLEKYETHLLQPEKCRCKRCNGKRRTKRPVQGKDLFMQLMYLVRCKEEMGIEADAMLQAADELWCSEGLDDSNVLFGVSPEGLADVSDADWVVLIMNIMVMEFNQLLFSRRWPIKWGLKETFAFLRTHSYKGPPYDKDFKFHDSFYFVTHIAFAISAYSAIKINPKDVPWLFNYNRRACLYWVKMAHRRQVGAPADLLVDIDGLAEAVDVMRGCGLTDGGDPLLCSAALSLLTLQRPDGSWPYWVLDTSRQGANGDPLSVEPQEPNFYNLVHPTWVAVQSLRDRNFEYDRKGNTQWAQFMGRLLKQSDLRRLERKIVYEKIPKLKRGMHGTCGKTADPTESDAADDQREEILERDGAHELEDLDGEAADGEDVRVLEHAARESDDGDAASVRAEGGLSHEPMQEELK